MKTVIVEGLIREDPRVKVHQIAEVADIEKITVHEIISNVNFVNALFAGFRKSST
jgi:hypothetical protein